ncbi:hypothetical protein [Virgibacillus ihumii]|uniref:hypothetical protein n=1 Tax=Virgibacillus ihumii TaxID=2686091 RepID=UPI00157E268A|nr:hypothetical protein [Virgibacillus ihumii]
MRITKRLLDFLYECFFLFTLMEILYIIAHGHAPVLPLILVTVLNAVFFLPFQRKKTVSVPMFFVLIIGSLLLGFFTCLNAYASVLWTALVVWRAFVHFVKVDIEHENQHALFIVSLVLCLIVYFPMTNGNNEILLMLPFIQFVFLITLKVLDMVGSQLNSSSRSYMLWGIGTIGTAVVISYLGIYLFPAVKTVLMSLFAGIGAVMGLLIYPVQWFLKLLIDEDEELLERDESKDKHSKNQENQDQLQNQTDDPSLFSDELIVLAVVVLVLVGLGIYFYKRKISIEMEAAGSNQIFKQTSSSGVIRRFQRSRPPKSAIRKKMYQLQKTLAKKGYPRYQHESIEEWFDRLDFNVAALNAVSTGYRKTRYGDQELTASERKKYEKGMKQLTEEAKSRNK